MRLRHPLAAANICPITTATALPSPSLRRPTWLRYPLFNRLRVIFEQANHTSIPTPVPLAHHSRKEPQCSTCTRGYVNNAWRKPFGRRIPSHGSLPPLPVRRTRFDTLVPSRKSFVALLLSETNIGTITSQRTFRSTLLEPTNHRTMPNGFSLAPLVFSANQCVRRYPVMDRLRCSLSEKAIGGVRLPSNTALKGIGVSNDHQY